VKTLGIIGGIAPESTVEYYRRVIEAYRRRTNDGSYPKIIINSIDLTAMLTLLRGDRARFVDYLLGELRKLTAAGVDLALFASNTPHLVYDDVGARSPVPLISIVETAADRAADLRLERVGLFGTAFTMQADFYPAVFARKRIAVVTPSAADQEYIHDKYMNELVNAVFSPDTRTRLLDIARRLAQSESLDAIVLGGTELPLLLGDAGEVGVPLLDTTRIHVERAVERLWNT
jgi:aspartate racemase